MFISCILKKIIIAIVIIYILSQYFGIESTVPPNSTIPQVLTTNTIEINPDKTLSINGKKTFPLIMYNMCNAYFEIVKVAEPCNPAKNSEFLLYGDAEQNANFIRLNYKSKFENAKVFYNTFTASIDNMSSIKGPYFFGYMQLDEPPDNKLTFIRDQYNKVKAKDTQHPVILNHWKDMMKWIPYTDIITWDMYPVKDNTGWTTGFYTREDAMYAYEHYSWNTFFLETEINSQLMEGKPVWAIIQANGIKEHHQLPMTPKEARANTYIAITMDVKGIGYWSYLGWGRGVAYDPTKPQGKSSGLYNNPKLHTYYRQLARELRSLNDILVLPTMDYSWEYHKGNLVSFSKNFTKLVLWKNRMNFNYILKQSEDQYYLIVVNKDSRPISDVVISITGLTGQIKAKTFGLETNGSGRAGRILNVVNGSFKDNFDGLAVHIYQIS